MGARRLLPRVLGIAAAVLIAMACSSADGDAGRVCEPGAEIYCRCENLEEGSQFCKDDGTGYERCEPCFDDYDTDGDYGFPEDDGSPTPNRDAGRDGNSAGCGNGAVDPGESCDDGNDVADDGCDACVAGGNPLGGSVCPGVTVHLWDAPFTLIGSTQNASTAHTGLECNGETGSGSPDRVYSIVSHVSGMLHVRVESATFATALFVRPTCDDVFSQSGCTLTDQLETPVRADTPLALTVDGAGNNQRGDFTLRFEVTPD